MRAVADVAQAIIGGSDSTRQGNATIQDFARFEECRRVILEDQELVLPRSFRRAAILLPIIKCLMRMGDPDLRDENGVSITTGRLLESTSSWRVITERAFMQGIIDANEVQLYYQLAEEVYDGEQGRASREILRKAAEAARSDHWWGSYGWEWVQFMESERGRMATSQHSKSVVSTMVTPFPASLHSLPPEIHLQIMADVREESLQDTVSLAATNQYFRRIARRPTSAELAEFQDENLDPELWFICVGCDLLLHRRHYNSFENKLVENAVNALCLSCGSRPLRKNGAFWPECCCSSPDCPGTMRPSARVGLARSLKETTSDGYFYLWAGAECREAPGSYYFGPGYRWKDEGGTLWLRCRNCYKDSVDYDTLSTECRPCRKSKPASAHYTKCISCLVKLPRRKFSRTLQQGDGPISHVCLDCGKRPLPERYNPVKASEGMYWVFEHEARECPELGGPGWRYGMGYLWTDRKRRVWRRCDCCRKPAQVQKSNSKGRCKECRRKARADVRKFNLYDPERRTGSITQSRSRSGRSHSMALRGDDGASAFLSLSSSPMTVSSMRVPAIDCPIARVLLDSL